jgi:FkbM family methyltransferase
MKTAICAIIKDEHLFLKEWIDWHLNLGFDAIHLFEDKGSDSHEDIVKEYDNVFLRRYEDDIKIKELLSEQWSSQRQQKLYDWFAKEFSNKYDWVAFIDIDEFVFFADGYNLDKLCEEFEPYPAVLLNWQMMGANRHITRPDSVIDAYTKIAVMNNPFESSWLYKSFVNLKRYKGMLNLHRAVDAVNTLHSPDYLQTCYSKAWINHYFTKSWEDWCDRIFNRGGTLVGHRKLADFFKCNADMLPMKKQLISDVAHKIPNGSYWLDKEEGLIAGGNVKKIMALNNRIPSQLVFDLGFHDGDTSEYYLKQGHTVVGVECNPSLMHQNTENFCSYIFNKKLYLVDKCISSEDNKKETFYISTNPVWSSLNKNIAERKEKSTPIEVDTITLASLISEYGCPYYCKIDIEGADILAIQSLESIQNKPKYISCEVDCRGKNEVTTDFPILNELYNLGYNKFMLINQRTNKEFRLDFRSYYEWFNYEDTLNKLNEIKKEIWEYGAWYDIYATY